jgi:glutamate-5-semialdehyde dehydrogenase
VTVAEISSAADIHAAMHALGAAARAASAELAAAKTETKNRALRSAAASIRTHADEILAANERDMAAARDSGATGAFLDRLMLDPDRIEAMARGLEDIAELPDPIGRAIDTWTRPSGNAVILRGGSESFHSSRAIITALHAGFNEAGLPAAAAQLVPTTDRAAVGEMLTMTGVIDIIIPRGGRSLIERVAAESRVPVIKHLDGICHVYVDRAADADMARDVTLNAKMRRPGICGAAETLLVHRAVKETHLAPILEALIDAGCEVRGDPEVCAAEPRAKPASDADWDTEYLDAIISVKLVDDLDEAIAHIAEHGSHHTDSIITADQAAAERFLTAVDSGIVLHNASTQFADGGEFGMGAEIGISTDKLHARGPVGVEQLTSYKYVVLGNGQTRP